MKIFIINRKCKGGRGDTTSLRFPRKCQVWVLNRSGGRVAGMIVERSGIELFAAFPLTTGINSIAIFMRVLRRFGSEPNASEA